MSIFTINRGLGRRGEAPVGAQGVGEKHQGFGDVNLEGIRLTKDVLFGDFKWFMMIFARDICKYDTLNKETRNLPSHHHHVHHPSYLSLRNAL